MTFADLLDIIPKGAASRGVFESVCRDLERHIFGVNAASLASLLVEIGSIPEWMPHNRTAEKIFSKAGELVLAKSLQELGLHATVKKERADCADVVAKSMFHNYSVVADAKVFRLSRSTVNQKDLKVRSMADWRGDHTYAVIVCPYFHYPKKNSQIYGQALDSSVGLLAWEHLLFLLKSAVRESATLSLASIWSISRQLAGRVKVSDKNRKDNFHRVGNELICQHLSLAYDNMKSEFLTCKAAAISRAEGAIEYWTRHVEEVKKYDRKQAIAELISELKIHEKIEYIRKYIKQLPKDDKIG